MSNDELELINIVRNSENPEKALITALEVIVTFLEQPLSFPKPLADSQLEFV